MGKGHSFATTRYILNGVTAWTAWGMPAGMMTASPAFRRVWDTVNGNLSGALQDGGHGVPGGGVGTDGLARIKGERVIPTPGRWARVRLTTLPGSYPT